MRPPVERVAGWCVHHDRLPPRRRIRFRIRLSSLSLGLRWSRAPLFLEGDEFASGRALVLDLMPFPFVVVELDLVRWIPCRICGCTAPQACAPGCTWVEEGLCSACIGFFSIAEDVADRFLEVWRPAIEAEIAAVVSSIVGDPEDVRVAPLPSPKEDR